MLASYDTVTCCGHAFTIFYDRYLRAAVLTQACKNSLLIWIFMNTCIVIILNTFIKVTANILLHYEVIIVSRNFHKIKITHEVHSVTQQLCICLEKLKLLFYVTRCVRGLLTHRLCVWLRMPELVGACALKVAGFLAPDGWFGLGLCGSSRFKRGGNG